MKFRTEIEVGHAPFEISHSDGISLFGSCFSESIGQRFERARFKTVINPHGIIFNPVSVAKALADVIDCRTYTAADLTEHDSLFHSFHHHGRFSANHPDKVISAINTSVRSAHEQLKEAKLIVITFGSAWAYEHRSSEKIVANCHRIPQTEFDKKLITCIETAEIWEPLMMKLHTFNPSASIVYTVSPVRHWRDGATANQLSKSHLLIACHKLADQAPFANYFPSFELVMDDLRDYRFFKTDMCHPNDMAVDYIWEKFSSWAFNEKTLRILKEVEPHLRFIEHRPIHISPEEFDFLLKNRDELIKGIIGQ